MDNKRKFILWLIGMILTATLSLIGALIGKSITGYLLFGIGVAASISLLVLGFVKKELFTEGHLRPLILGVTLGIFIAASAVIFIQHGFKVTPVTGNNAAMASAYRSAMGGSNGNFQSYRGSFSGNGSFTGGTGNFTRNFNGSSSSGSSGSNSSSSSSTNTSAIRAMAIRNMFITLAGWIFLVVGIIILVVALIRFLKKQTDYSGRRWQLLLAGFLVSGLISASTTHMLLPQSRSRNMPNMTRNSSGQQFVPNGTMPSGMPGDGAVLPPGETVTPTIVPTTAFPTKTPTLKPTQTPTQLVLTTIVTCVDADTRAGLIIHDFPSDSAAMVGTIPPGGCFTLNGRSSKYPDWYQLAPGQNGMGGIQVYVDDSKTPLWVHAVNIDATEDNLNSLTDVDVN